MANVHGFRDLNNNNNNNNRNRNFQQYYQQPQYGGDYDQDANNQQVNNLQNIPLLNFQIGGQDKDPRKENIFDMCKYYCCPTINIKQFIVIMTIIDILVFIITLIFSLSAYFGKPLLNPQYFLGPNPETLYKFGAKCDYAMQQEHQYWRFITPCFLHAGFLHILSNMFFQLIFGVGLESTIGTTRIIVIYFVSGIGGNLFSTLLSHDMAIGASTCLFGILIAYLAYLVLNWDELEPLGMTRFCMACMIVMIIFLNFLYDLGGVSYTSGDNSKINEGQGVTDWQGHLGGLISGAFISLAVIKPMSPNKKKNKVFKWIGVGLCSGFFIICFLCFFLISRQKSQPNPNNLFEILC